MVILSQNRTDRSFFVGMTKDEYYTFIKPILGNTNQNIEKEQIMLHYTENMDEDYEKIIKEIYGYNEIFEVYVSVKKDLSSAFLAEPNYPFGNLWNGYSPWERFPTKEIKDINEIKSNDFIDWENEKDNQ